MYAASNCFHAAACCFCIAGLIAGPAGLPLFGVSILCSVTALVMLFV